MNRIDDDGGCAEARLVFLVGAPRSGTSWFQRLLAGQAGWVTVPELHYVSEVVRPALISWNHWNRWIEEVLGAVHDGVPMPERALGIASAIDEREFKGMLRLPFTAMVRRGEEEHGEVRVLLEKTPSNSLLLPYIRQLFEDAYVVHLVRDPRAVVRSLRDASRNWGVRWAPRSVLVASLIWRCYVSAASRDAVSAPTRHLRLRYEDVRRDAPGEVGKVRGFVGAVPPAGGERGPGTARQVVSDRVRAVWPTGELDEPEGFGDGRTQRPALTTREEWLVEAVCGSVMATYGYATTHRSARLAGAVVDRLWSSASRRLSQERKEFLALGLNRLRAFEWARNRCAGGRRARVGPRGDRAAA